jgi:hypothetical protein
MITTGTMAGTIFLANFNWTSFQSGTTGSGPESFGAQFGSTYAFTVDFGLSNQHYGTAAHANDINVGQPQAWTDYLVGIFYSNDWNTGWLELHTRAAGTGGFTQRTFPGANTGRLITATLGGPTSAVNDNRFGLYSDVPTNGALKTGLVTDVRRDRHERQDRGAERVHRRGRRRRRDARTPRRRCRRSLSRSP